MELSEYLRILRDRWLSIAMVALVIFGAVAAATLVMTPQYTSSVRMFFAVEGGDSVSDLVQGSTFTEKQMGSYIEVARSPLVLVPVGESLELSQSTSELADALSVTVAAETSILEISATNEDPGSARDLANAVAEELTQTVGGLSPERPDGSEAVQATMLSTAEVPVAPSSPNVNRNLAIGAVLGLMLGIGVALLREVLDTKVRSESDLAAFGPSTLAVVPVDQSAMARPVFMRDAPTSALAEAVRRLRTNLQFVDLTDRPSSILVTSSVDGEGKTTMAINLAASLADTGSRVILVDADLRRPSIAEFMGLEGRAGLTTVLIGKADISDVVQPWQGTSLDVLPSGQVPPNPSEILGSAAMSRLLNELRTKYDMVIIDSPPILPVTDSIILSKMTGGTLLVAGADRIHKAQLAGSLEALEQVDARLLGIVLNKADAKGSSNYYGEYRTIDDPVLTGSRTTSKARPMAHARRSTRTEKKSPTPARR